MSVTTSAPWVLPLDDPATANLSVAGGKAANLGQLPRARATVPDGFVVTTAGYRAAVTDSALEEAADPAARREIVAGTVLPVHLRDSILAAYRALGGGAVAVRSSGTAEDLADAAFAGQHDTFLNITAPDDLLDAIKQCWASLWSDRAIDYRSDRGIDDEELAIAVIVQRMTQSEVSGVMFTADPVSGARDRMVIDASPGLGEAVVSGMVTPDHYVVKKRGGKPLHSTLGRREVVIAARQGGGTTHTTGSATGTAALDKSTIRRLARIGRDIEAHFGSPQDIEWSIADDQVYVLQSRPITALPHAMKKPGLRQRIVALILSEIVTKRPYPLDIDAWTVPIFNGVRHFAAGMGVKFPTLESMLVMEDSVVRRIDPRPPRPTFSTPFIIWRNIRRGRRDFRAERWQDDPRFTDFVSIIERADTTDVEAASPSQLFALWDETSRALDLVMDLRHDYLPATVADTAKLRLRLALLRRGDLFGRLVAGAETRTDVTNTELHRLAHIIRQDPDLRPMFAAHDASEIAERLGATSSGRALREELATFLKNYGHRETSSIAVVSAPTWVDSPRTVLEILKGLSSDADRSTPSSASRAALRELLSHPRFRTPHRQERMRQLTAAAQEFTRFREDTHFYFMMPQPRLRRVLLEFGRRLRAAKAIETAEDVFHLRRAELEAVVWPPGSDAADRLRDKATRRAALRSRLGDGTPIDPRYLAKASAPGDALVSGLPSSPGVVTAPARIIMGPSDFSRLRAGDIIVAPFTNPAWTPLFARAAGVIVDTGAAMSHAAIVAREYSIPAVLGCGEATKVLTDGDTVTLDGGAGTVRRGTLSVQ